MGTKQVQVGGRENQAGQGKECVCAQGEMSYELSRPYAAQRKGSAQLYIHTRN